ncbi:MAG: DUF3037 domain-containing protein [Prosthecobacter sp.]|nr:DUF3037 domain-containing protein [Prosthecobacter sp.]
MNSVQHVCNYAFLRFQPYEETGEFVNVAAVGYCPDLRWFGFAYDGAIVRQRVTQFFPGVKTETFLWQMGAMLHELERVRDLLANTDVGMGGRVFQELIRHRQSAMRFSEVRTALTNDPEALLQRAGEPSQRQGATLVSG